MSDTAFSLPMRLLRAAGKPFTVARGSYFTLIMLFALGVALTVWQGPDLYRDVLINQQPVPLPNGQVRNGECSTSRSIFTTCSGDISYQYQGQNYQQHIRLAFIGGGRDYRVYPVISGSRPELATLSLSLEKLTNRLITFGVAMFIILAIMVNALRNLRIARRANRDWQEESRLQTVPLVITNVAEAKGRSWVSYRALNGGKPQGPVYVSRFEAGQEPLFAPNPRVSGEAVGARMETARAPLMLDARLERLNLTQSERETVLGEGAKAIAAAVQERRDFAEPHKRKGAGPVLRFGLLAVILLAALGGYWYWYVTADTSRAGLGQQINAWMPQPIRQWGCEQLAGRFPAGTRFEGCAFAPGAAPFATTPGTIPTK